MEESKGSIARYSYNSALKTQNLALVVAPAVAVIQFSGLVGQGIVPILEYGLVDLGGTGAFVACSVKGTDAEIVGLA